SVCITFDKLDKIDIAGVCAELSEKEMPASAIAALADFLQKGTFTLADVAALCADKTLGARVQLVMDSVAAIADGAYSIVFTPSLVRGQGYYTGMVFEVVCPAFAGAVGGGGRYDTMIGKFLGKDVPAVGFSIGFERIAAVLLESNTVVPAEKAKLALLYAADADFAAVLKTAAILRADYQVTVLTAAKKVGKQLEKLAADSYTAVCFAEQYPAIKLLR
ncbi:MAG: ATP phosphoribosyltransferase regulatory subunit, partial [Ruthenibacterium sp.]